MGREKWADVTGVTLGDLFGGWRGGAHGPGVLGNDKCVSRFWNIENDERCLLASGTVWFLTG